MKVFSQVEGIDYSEVLSPTIKLASIWFWISLVVSYHLQINKMDGNTKFLNGYLEEEI